MQTKLILLISILFLVSGCVTQPKDSGVDDKKRTTDIIKDKLSSLKANGEKMLTRAGDKNTMIKDLPMTYKPSAYSVGIEKDVLDRSAQSYGLIDSPELKTYLSSIRTKLVDASGMIGLQGDVYLEANLDIHAEASSSGNIYLNWGLLKHLTYEDDVAALIAHELAHVMLNHNDSDALLDYNRKAQWFQMKGVAITAVARSQKDKSQKNVSLKGAELSQLQKLQLILNLNSSLISPSWQRTQEREADLLAVDLLVNAGYNPDGLINLLSILKQSEDVKNEKPDPKVMLSNAYNLANNPDNLSQMQSAVDLLSPFLGSTHPDAAIRIKDVSKYLRKHYEEVNTSPPYKKEAWNKITNSPKLKKVISAYDGAFAAEKLLQSGNVKEAYQLSKKTINGGKAHSYPAYIHSTILEAMNQTKDSESALTLALTSNQSSGIVYSKLASKNSEKGNNKKALELIKTAHVRFAESPSFIPELIRYNKLAGNDTEARSLLDNCALNHTNLKDLCYESMN